MQSDILLKLKGNRKKRRIIHEYVMNIIPGNKRVKREAPVIFDAVKIRVAYPTVQNLKPHVPITCCSVRINTQLSSAIT